MNFSDWYTDTVDVYRNQATVVDGLTKHDRVIVYTALPCRVYQDSGAAVSMKREAAEISQTLKLALSNAYDIHPGDELIVHRGGGLGYMTETTRAFAGDPHHHYEPFGAVMPQLSHQEITLLQQERV